MEQRLSKLISLVVKGEDHNTGRRTASHSQLPSLSPDVASPILLEIGELAMEQGYRKVAADCLSAISVEHLHAPDHHIQRQLLSAYVTTGDTNTTVYTKTAIEVQLLCVSYEYIQFSHGTLLVLSCTLRYVSRQCCSVKMLWLLLCGVDLWR